MTESEWLAKEQELRAAAFKQLVSLAETSYKITGYTEARHWSEFIRSLDESIYNTLGDCPE